jgi:hypothetical protein
MECDLADPGENWTVLVDSYDVVSRAPGVGDRYCFGIAICEVGEEFLIDAGACV